MSTQPSIFPQDPSTEAALDPTPALETGTFADDSPFKVRPPNYARERLAMSIDRRLVAGSFLSFFSGFILGSSHAGRMASLRFRAENAHRLPYTNPGWYLYHKSKNYYKMKEGIQAGMKSGFRLARWVCLYLLVEEALDIFRGTWRAGRTLREMEGIDELEMQEMRTSVEQSRTCLSSALAGMATAGLWSFWNRFPMPTAARTIRVGLMVGLGYGLGQDGLRWARLKYIGEEDPLAGWWLRPEYRKAAGYKVSEEDLESEQKPES